MQAEVALLLTELYTPWRTKWLTMQVSSTSSSALTVPAVTAKQTLSAYTVDSFTQSIQQQVGVFGTIAEG